MKVDHLAVVCRDLDTGCAFVEAALGVPMQPGGHHVRFGTHNRLLSLGPNEYLEVICPDPNAAVFDGPRWFNLDDAPQEPRLANWICQVPDIEAALRDAPASVGQALPLSRGDLAWSLTVPFDGRLPYDGAWPTLIDWGNSDHPASGLTDYGVRLKGLHIAHPQSQDFGPRLAAALGDDRITHTSGPLHFRATFDTPAGPRHL